MPERFEINPFELFFLALFAHAVVAVVGALARDFMIAGIGCCCVSHDVFIATWYGRFRR